MWQHFITSAKNKKVYFSAIYYSISMIFRHIQEINPINQVH